MTSSEEIQPQFHVTKFTRIELFWSAGVSLFWVLFMWGFWEKNVYAFGANAFGYLAATTALFIWIMRRKGPNIRENLFWIVPIGFIALSFLIYDNPFLKWTSLFLFPVLFACFYNHSFFEEKSRVNWDIRFLANLFVRCFSFLRFVGRSARLHAGAVMSTKNGIARRIVFGAALFFVIALTVIIPLLSSADAVFAAQTSDILKWLQAILSTSTTYKTVFGLLLSVSITAAILAWSRPFAHAEKPEQEKHNDPIISGIVLGGTLMLYLLFLTIQFKQLWTGSLPFDFKETAYLVKSGFWQLLFLTFINIFIYFFTYRKTVSVVQKILVAFMGASLLLLVSAAQRMALYVTYYGFSYEKFFAAYTVIFCAILFIWLISRLFVRKRSNIVKFVVVLFLWMYAAITVFPVEQAVLRTNVALSQKKDSRIRLYELTMLSPDVLGLVKKLWREGKLYQVDPNSALTATDDWQPWIIDRENRVENKAWYEKNFMNLLSSR